MMEFSPMISVNTDMVADWLIEAFKIDRRLPSIERPKKPGSAHPAMEYSREERDEWELIELDPKRFAPTREEIASMELAFKWLLSVRESDPDGCFALKNWALRKAGGKTNRSGANSIKALARKMGVTDTALLKRKDRALSLITSTLCKQNGIVQDVVSKEIRPQAAQVFACAGGSSPL
jgi:hypothetical protein